MMQIDNEFRVRAPADKVFAYLQDVEEVVTCVPGAAVTAVVADNEYAGLVKLKVGPLALNFKGSAVIEITNETAREITIRGSGSDQQGRGAADVTVVARVVDEEDGSSQVLIEQDLRVTGKIAQFGRGVMKDVSQRLSLEFAQCLGEKIALAESGDTARLTAARPASSDSGAGTEHRRDVPDAPAHSGAPEPQRALGALRLILWALGRALARFFRRIFRRDEGKTRK